jgi:LPS export ABC transporter protein LptC
MNNLHTFHNRKFFAAALLTGCLFLLACENDQVAIDAWTKDKLMQEEATQVETLISQNGRLKARLTAPLMLRVMADTQYIEFPNTLHVDFFDDSVKVETRLTSMYGKYFENHNKVYLRDSVVVINRAGDTLRCPDLWWDQTSGKFFTNKLSKLDGKDKHIVANQGLEATQDLSVITFNYPTGPVKFKENGYLE